MTKNYFNDKLIDQYFDDYCTTMEKDDYTYFLCDQNAKFYFVNITFIIDGYGYIFRGKIYSKYETEQYWNIIDQYKQGMREQNLNNQNPITKTNAQKNVELPMLYAGVDKSTRNKKAKNIFNKNVV